MRRQIRNLALLSAVLCGVLALCPMIGSTFIPWSAAFAAGGVDHDIFVKTRLPRLLLAVLTGSALACSGAVFQSVFRNALATPYTLGTASGGTFGAILAVFFGLDFSFGGFSTVTVAAFLGALLSVSVVYALGRHRGGLTTSTMLLAGVTVGFFFTALTMFLHYLLDYTQSHRMLVWTMGSLEITEYGPIVKIAPFILVSLVFIIRMGRDYNQLCLGEDIARTRGVETERVKKISFVLTSVMVGAAVSVTGPIGFVGLIVPHMLRMTIGSDYRTLLPACVLAGGAFLALCDTLARLLIAPSEMPVGVITAMLGGPFFIFLLLRRGAENF
jgi:iron complex transport system permease protein